MCRFTTIAPIIVFMLFVGCTKKIYLPSEVIEKTNTEYRDTTIYIDIPREVVSEITDTLSILETSFAKSRAFVDPKGRLNHTLENKAISIPVKTKTITIRTTVEKKIPYPVVEKKKVVPSWCWYLLVFVLLFVIFKISSKIKALIP